MDSRGSLIGRAEELRSLRERLDAALQGSGGMVLLAGEAGVGKTRLMAELASDASIPVLTGSAQRDATPAYGPLISALRSYLRQVPDGLRDCGPLGDHLRLLLPELGPPPEASDRTTLHEAIRCALIAVCRDGGALMVLDDLQWSDTATLELFTGLGPSLDEIAMLVVAAYRSEELPREHPLRAMRHELRRRGGLTEIRVTPLDEHGTAELMEGVLGDAVSGALVRTVHERSQGVPFFVEELSAALRAEGALQRGRAGLELAEGSRVVVPENVRDAVLLAAADLSPAARAAVEAAAVAGERFDLELVAELGGDKGVAELIERALVVEESDGRAAFRHALVREALYRDVPWLRRRSLHRELAERLEAAGAEAVEIAPHWLGARDDAKARTQLLAAGRRAAAMHAYRDAATMTRNALDLWPEHEQPHERLAALELHAGSAEMGGDLADAARAWRELAESHDSAGRVRDLALARQRLGRVHALQGDRPRAIDALVLAADAFERAGEAGAAAAERLAAADYLQFAGRHGPALELSTRAGADARAAGRTDLVARALAAEGVVRAKRGEFERGLALVQEGLSLALENGLTAEAADAYQRLGTAFETSGDYDSARDALAGALDLCRVLGDEGPEAGCVACMAYVLRELGEWPRAAELSRELIAAHDGDGVRAVADGVLGFVQAFRGELGPARRVLTSGFDTARRLDVFSMQVDCAGALALVADYDSDPDTAIDRCRFLLSRWEQSEDHHYAIWGLRLAASLFARAGLRDEANACAEGLGRIASNSGHPDALAALAHALGETALLGGDPELAAEQLGRAVEIHRSLRIPAERAQILHRAGVALAAAGDRETAVERQAEAYRLARNLGARPLAGRAARAMEELGESAEERLGRRAAADADGGGLSRREQEVMRLVAEGRTNREIAGELFLSPRTVDMHVRNILSKLDCRSRVEASAKAGRLGLLRGA